MISVTSLQRYLFLFGDAYFSYRHLTKFIHIVSRDKTHMPFMEKSRAKAATAILDREDYDGALHSIDDIHNTDLTSLKGEFCMVRATETVLKEIA